MKYGLDHKKILTLLFNNKFLKQIFQTGIGWINKYAWFYEKNIYFAV